MSQPTTHHYTRFDILEMPITNLSSIQLMVDDLSDFSPRLTSAQPIYSLTAPGKPSCVQGWRDRWWLNNSPAQTVAISYWLFASDDEALTVAETGRFRLSTRTTFINGRRESIYQSSQDADCRLADRVWQAGSNFLFVRRNVVVHVAEFGNQVPYQTTLSIARQILEKIENQLKTEG